MRYAVIGAGGVGAYFGAKLALDGNEVMFAARGAHGVAMAARGLRVLLPQDELQVRPVTLLDRLPQPGFADIVLIAVKMYDLEAAAQRARHLVHAETAVVPLQNGVEATAVMRRHLPEHHVCGGVAYISGHIEAPGRVRVISSAPRLVFGELGAADSWRLDALLAACQAAGIDALLSPDITTEIWRKLVLLAPFAAVTCLARAPIGQVRADPAMWRTLEALVAETAAVARANGAALGTDVDAEALATMRDRLPAEMRASMLVDLEAGRRLELEWLTGAVVRFGRERGVAVPESAAVLEALEAASIRTRPA